MTGSAKGWASALRRWDHSCSAVSALRGVPGVGGAGSWAALPCPHPVPSVRSLLPCSVPPVPSASCPGQSCSCTRLSSTGERSCLCVRSVGTGPRAGTACRCTPKPSTGGGWPGFPWAWPCRQNVLTQGSERPPRVWCLQGQQRAEQVCQTEWGRGLRAKTRPCTSLGRSWWPFAGTAQAPHRSLGSCRVAQASLFPWLGLGGLSATVE